MINWRIYIIIIFLLLSVIDISLTYFYVHKYKKWQPNKPFNLIERNPLIVFLWNKFGLTLGTIISSVIIFSLVYIIAKESHWIVVALLGIVLLFTLYNHHNNINLLYQLIEKYPTGYLPVETFGDVAGNNPIK